MEDYFLACVAAVQNNPWAKLMKQLRENNDAKDIYPYIIVLAANLCNKTALSMRLVCKEWRTIIDSQSELNWHRFFGGFLSDKILLFPLSELGSNKHFIILRWLGSMITNNHRLSCAFNSDMIATLLLDYIVYHKCIFPKDCTCDHLIKMFQTLTKSWINEAKILIIISLLTKFNGLKYTPNSKFDSEQHIDLPSTDVLFLFLTHECCLFFWQTYQPTLEDFGIDSTFASLICEPATPYFQAGCYIEVTDAVRDQIFAKLHFDISFLKILLRRESKILLNYIVSYLHQKHPLILKQWTHYIQSKQPKRKKPKLEN